MSESSNAPSSSTLSVSYISGTIADNESRYKNYHCNDENFQTDFFRPRLSTLTPSFYSMSCNETANTNNSGATNSEISNAATSSASESQRNAAATTKYMVISQRRQITLCNKLALIYLCKIFLTWYRSTLRMKPYLLAKRKLKTHA